VIDHTDAIGKKRIFTVIIISSLPKESLFFKKNIEIVLNLEKLRILAYHYKPDTTLLS